MVNNPNYNASLTLKLYALSAILFGTYGGRVCPMLERLSLADILLHVSIIFSILFFVRHFLLSNHQWAKEAKFAKLDTLSFFIASLPLAIYYNTHYHFPIDSNLKVLFGMSMFGFFTGCLLQLQAGLSRIDTIEESGEFDFSLQGERSSLVKQMISLVITLLVVLTTVLTMASTKNLLWLEMNPDQISNGLGKASVIKELVYLAFILTGYATAIMWQWSKLTKRILLSQENALKNVSEGNIGIRLPIFNHDEIGYSASLTNEMLDSLESAQTEIKTTRDVAIVSLSALAETRDNETGAHILRTQEYVKILAEYLSQFDKYESMLTPNYIDLLHKSAPLHDAGKVGIPDNILLKPGKLTDDEFEVMKEHPQIGANALSIAEKQLGSSSFLNIAKEIALTHHEKWNGSGYPNKLSGENIPLSGRLMAMADVYDALTCKRVYKKAFSHEKAKAIILEGDGTHFDPDIVQAFLALEEQFIQIAEKFKE